MPQEPLEKAEDSLHQAQQYSKGAQSGGTGSLKDAVMYLLYAVELIIRHLKEKEARYDR